MRNLVLGGLVAAAAVAAVPASATVVTFTNGVYTIPSYVSNPTVRQNFETLANGAYNPNPVTTGETTTGTSVFVAQGTVPGQTVDTDSNSTNKYLSIQSAHRL